MGTFIVRPTTVSSYSDWSALIGGIQFLAPITEAQLLEANNDGLSPDTLVVADVTGLGVGAYDFDSVLGMGGDSIFLDGSPIGIDVNSLPPGFTITSAAVKGEVGWGFGGGLTFVFTVYRGIVEVFSISSADIFPNGPAPNPGSQSIDFDLGPIDPVDLGTALRAACPLNVNTGADGSNNLYYQLRIEGEYTAEPSLITLNPASGNVHPGQAIEVSSELDLSEVEFAITNGDQVIPVELGPDNTIEIPPFGSEDCLDCYGDCPQCEDCITACEDDLSSAECQACLENCFDCLEDCLEDIEAAEECQESMNEPETAPVPITIICMGPVPPFSGSVTLGTFTVLVANGSGIYQFVPGKTNDTIYSSERDGTTYDVKIPNPSAKAGFFES